MQLRVGRYELDALVDVKGVPEVAALRLDGAGLDIGAAVPCYRIYEDAKVAAA